MTEVGESTVAVVDDDHGVRDSLQLLLELMGYTIQTFASAREFLEAERQHVSCLILDHRMPNMTGLQLAEKLRADGATIPILLITGSPSPAIVARARELGIYYVLEKPPSEDDLLEFINGSFSRRR